MRNKWTVLWLLFCTCFASHGGAQEYKSVSAGFTFSFPKDYFNHEEFQTEWWYYTGNVKSSDGHRYGYELTFFRQGVSRVESNQPWFVHDIWMAHLALSDINGQRFYSEERLNRSGPGIAGVDARSGLVWNGNWEAQIGAHSEQLRGVADRFSLGLTLVPVKQPVVQGQNGASQKAEGSGHASHYFSLTRLNTTGSIDFNGKSYQVEGTSWIDHEFFTGSMAENETGWDWLSIQLDDGFEIMLYRLRHSDGTIDPYSSGSYVDAGGKSQFLSAKDFSLTPESEIWESPTTRAKYPIRWRVSIPILKMDLEITTPLKTQELTGGFGPSYWEGAIDINGSRNLSPIRGVGYLEMTGYADAGKPIIPR